MKELDVRFTSHTSAVWIKRSSNTAAQGAQLAIQRTACVLMIGPFAKTFPLPYMVVPRANTELTGLARVEFECIWTASWAVWILCVCCQRRMIRVCVGMRLATASPCKEVLAKVSRLGTR